MNKFIITISGELRFGNVSLHKDLLPYYDDDCYGGGMWAISKGGMSIDLYGSSYDFGKADFSMVRSINWDGVGGNPLPLVYYPNYPDPDNAVQITPVL